MELIIILSSIYLIINSFIAGRLYEVDMVSGFELSKTETVFFVALILMFGIFIIIGDKIRK